MSKTTEAIVYKAEESLITAKVLSGSVMMNEVGYIHIDGGIKLKSEVVRIRDNFVDMQVYEDTRGVKVGDKVQMSGEMLSIELGPGLMGSIYDGLQNPLEVLAKRDGFFLQRGEEISALDQTKLWEFRPTVLIGDRLYAGDVLGTVQERHFEHKIFVPFDIEGEVNVSSIRSGSFRIDEVVAKLDGKESVEVKLFSKWPVRFPITKYLLRSELSTQLYPQTPLITGQRIVDTLFPIPKGGTACIPGPFGAGKTVLQQLIAKHASVDIVIVVACGERAGEVVETLNEYPELIDPKTGSSLMSRTVIICNTSSMPVAARESSIYTGLTIGEYYRQMGYDVLLLADSTSRWAQAMREISGRLEEIPGEEAFPAYLESRIKSVYERGGVIKNAQNEEGSLTMIGTVSPAGGNFEEPVTQATLNSVKTFLGLSYDRAYKRFYPAIDPLISWSRYLEQLEPWLAENLALSWVEDVKMLMDILHKGDTIYQMMKVAGEDGISVEDFTLYQKALLADMVYLQQDAFDDIDASRPINEQLDSFLLLKKILLFDFSMEEIEQVRERFTKLTNIYKNLNYAIFDSQEYKNYKKEIEKLLI